MSAWFATIMKDPPSGHVIVEEEQYDKIHPFLKITYGGNDAVGCAVNKCGEKFFVACCYNYWPTVNYKPLYITEDVCSHCKKNYQVEDCSEYDRCFETL
ncbi:unnamed protein product [Strongylus vulgaris]|uniref:SCP domain-containing protein n=1 Tax=Strongylus vulgaris TaxID=40348 RepID=A0A3P7M1E2_STRVU|nr:unnamed protein product [Strongylus vulgaris]